MGNFRKHIIRLLCAVMLCGTVANNGYTLRAEETSDDPMDLRDVPEEQTKRSIFGIQTFAVTSNAVQFPASSSLVHNTQFSETKAHYGLDISDHNGTVNWAKVKNAGVEFAFLRAAYRGYGRESYQGKVNADSEFKTNLVNAKANGVKGGVYVYSQAVTEAEAIEEAQAALNLIGSVQLDLPIMIDREFDDDDDYTGRLAYAYSQGQINRAKETSIIKAFCDTVEKAGYKGGVYASTCWILEKAYRSQLEGKYSLWIADWNTKNSYPGSYEFWQYWPIGKVDGVNFNVDMNVWYEGGNGSGTIEIPEVPETDGYWVEGSSGELYFCYADGTYAKNGFEKIDGDIYYFKENGVMATSWYLIDYKWYYFGLDGKMTTGWRLIKGDWHYFSSDGAERYGWQEVSGKTYYFDEDGIMQKGWVKISGFWYYFGTDGNMCTGWKQLSGDWYYLDTDGKMATGWKKVNGSWYYLASSGKMQTGWMQYGGKWYYLMGSGKMATGWYKTSSGWHFFGDDGAERYGWQKVNGDWYYMNADGVMLTGWQKISGSWYYFYNSGAMASSTTINGYYVNASGVWVS